MRRITIAVMGTLSALVALFSYHTSTNSQAAASTSSGSSTGAGTASASTSEGSSAAEDSTGSGSASSGSSSSSTSRTYTGPATDTRWGVVQVRITVKSGKITKSEAVQYPNGNPRDQEINSFAVPQLNSEVLKSQSGSIDAVSGATVTSDGYIQSLQSAIDQAHL